MDDNRYDLFWYAFNYRNSSTQDAGKWFEELQQCVNRLIERGAIMDRDDNSGWKEQQDEQQQMEEEYSAVFGSFDQDFSKFVAQRENGDQNVSA